MVGSLDKTVDGWQRNNTLIEKGNDIAKKYPSIGRDMAATMGILEARTNSLNKEYDSSVDKLATVRDQFKGLQDAIKNGADSATIKQLSTELLTTASNTEGVKQEFIDLVAQIVQAASDQTRLNDLSQQLGNIVRDNTGAMDMLAGSLGGVLVQIQSASDALQNMRQFTGSIDDQLKNVTLTLGVLEKGGDQIAVNSAQLRADNQAMLDAALATGDALAIAAAQTDFSKNAAAIDQIEAGQRRIQARRDADAASARAHSQAVKDNAKAQKDAAKEIEQAQNSATGILSKYMTVAQQAAADQRKLTDAVNLAGGQAWLQATGQVGLYNKALADLKMQQDELYPTIVAFNDILANNLNSTFDQLIDGTISAKEAFNDMIDNIIKDMAKFIYSQQVKAFTNLLTSALTASSGGLLGVIGGVLGFRAPAPIIPSTDVALPRVQMQAANLSVSPLSGIPSISYGARTTSTTAGNSFVPEVSVVVNNNSSAEVATKTSTDSKGNRTIEILMEEKVKSMFATGKMDRTMQNSFGVRRKPS